MFSVVYTVWVLGVAAEILLLGILALRGITGKVPTFTAYVYWLALSDVGMFVVFKYLPGRYLQVYQIEVLCDGVILFVVLFDLARSVLRPLPSIASRTILLVLLPIMADSGTVLWRIADFWSISEWHTAMRLELTLSLLRILFLVLLGGLIQFLNNRFIPIGWGERELQIATGIGAYALFSLAGSILHTYHWSERITFVIGEGVSISFLFVLIYWIVVFLRPERTPAAQLAEPNPAEQDFSSPSTLWKEDTEVTYIRVPVNRLLAN